MHFSGNQCVWHLGKGAAGQWGSGAMALSPKLLMQHSLTAVACLVTRKVAFHLTASPHSAPPRPSRHASRTHSLAIGVLILNSFPSVPASLWLGGNEALSRIGLKCSPPESFFACGRVIACNRCERQNLQWLPKKQSKRDSKRDSYRERVRERNTGSCSLRVPIKFKDFY